MRLLCVAAYLSCLSEQVAMESMKVLVTGHLPVIAKRYGLASSSRKKGDEPALMRSVSRPLEGKAGVGPPL